MSLFVGGSQKAWEGKLIDNIIASYRKLSTQLPLVGWLVVFRVIIDGYGGRMLRRGRVAIMKRFPVHATICQEGHLVSFCCSAIKHER